MKRLRLCALVLLVLLFSLVNAERRPVKYLNVRNSHLALFRLKERLVPRRISHAIQIVNKQRVKNAFDFLPKVKSVGININKTNVNKIQHEHKDLNGTVDAIVKCVKNELNLHEIINVSHMNNTSTKKTKEVDKKLFKETNFNRNQETNDMKLNNGITETYFEKIQWIDDNYINNNATHVIDFQTTIKYKDMDMRSNPTEQEPSVSKADIEIDSATPLATMNVNITNMTTEETNDLSVATNAVETSGSKITTKNNLNMSSDFTNWLDEFVEATPSSAKNNDSENEVLPITRMIYIRNTNLTEPNVRNVRDLVSSKENKNKSVSKANIRSPKSLSIVPLSSKEQVKRDCETKHYIRKVIPKKLPNEIRYRFGFRFRTKPIKNKNQRGQLGVELVRYWPPFDLIEIVQKKDVQTPTKKPMLYDLMNTPINKINDTESIRETFYTNIFGKKVPINLDENIWKNMKDDIIRLDSSYQSPKKARDRFRYEIHKSENVQNTNASKHCMFQKIHKLFNRFKRSSDITDGSMPHNFLQLQPHGLSADYDDEKAFQEMLESVQSDDDLLTLIGAPKERNVSALPYDHSYDNKYDPHALTKKPMHTNVLKRGYNNHHHHDHTNHIKELFCEKFDHFNKKYHPRNIDIPALNPKELEVPKLVEITDIDSLNLVSSIFKPEIKNNLEDSMLNTLNNIPYSPNTNRELIFDPLLADMEYFNFKEDDESRKRIFKKPRSVDNGNIKSFFDNSLAKRVKRKAQNTGEDLAYNFFHPESFNAIDSISNGLKMFEEEYLKSIEEAKRETDDQTTIDSLNEAPTDYVDKYEHPKKYRQAYLHDDYGDPEIYRHVMLDVFLNKYEQDTKDNYNSKELEPPKITLHSDIEAINRLDLKRDRRRTETAESLTNEPFSVIGLKSNGLNIFEDKYHEFIDELKEETHAREMIDALEVSADYIDKYGNPKTYRQMTNHNDDETVPKHHPTFDEFLNKYEPETKKKYNPKELELPETFHSSDIDSIYRVESNANETLFANVPFVKDEFNESFEYYGIDSFHRTSSYIEADKNTPTSSSTDVTKNKIGPVNEINSNISSEDGHLIATEVSTKHAATTAKPTRFNPSLADLDYLKDSSEWHSDKLENIDFSYRQAEPISLSLVPNKESASEVVDSNTAVKNLPNEIATPTHYVIRKEHEDNNDQKPNVDKAKNDIDYFDDKFVIDNTIKILDMSEDAFYTPTKESKTANQTQNETEYNIKLNKTVDWVEISEGVQEQELKIIDKIEKSPLVINFSIYRRSLDINKPIVRKVQFLKRNVDEDFQITTTETISESMTPTITPFTEITSMSNVNPGNEVTEGVIVTPKINDLSVTDKKSITDNTVTTDIPSSEPTTEMHMAEFENVMRTPLLKMLSYRTKRRTTANTKTALNDDATVETKAPNPSTNLRYIGLKLNLSEMSPNVMLKIDNGVETTTLASTRPRLMMRIEPDRSEPGMSPTEILQLYKELTVYNPYANNPLLARKPLTKDDIRGRRQNALLGIWPLKLKPVHSDIVGGVGPMDIWRGTKYDRVFKEDVFEKAELEVDEEEDEEFRRKREIRGTGEKERMRKAPLLCAVFSRKGFEAKDQLIKKTWGRRCDTLVFITSKDDSMYDDLTDTAATKPVERKVWDHLMSALLYMYELHHAEASWFLKTDVDSYVLVENLHRMVRDYEYNKPYFFGLENSQERSNFVLSKEALRKLVVENYYAPKCNTGYIGMDECLSALSIRAIHPRDKRNRPLFYTHVPLDFEARKKNHSILAPVPWSDTAVAFQGATREAILTMDFFLYRIKPFDFPPDILNQIHR